MFNIIPDEKPLFDVEEKDLDDIILLKISNHCKEIVKNYLQKNPKCRPSAKDLLAYKFIKMYND